MPKSPRLTDSTGEVRDLKTSGLKRFRGAVGLPGALKRKLGFREPQVKGLLPHAKGKG